MVRLSDLPEYERQHLLAKNMAPLGPPAWVSRAKPISQMRFAIVTTAGCITDTMQPSSSRMPPLGLLMVKKILTT